MRITRIKLKNFAGIYAGTGLKEIDIEFDSENTMNMFLAANGKGKSVLMSCLTPFRETFDDRKDLIIKETIGVKELWLEDGSDEYKITHYYEAKNNKSYIEKNGIELNDNGGVKSFLNVLKDELNLDTDYIKIGKLGAGIDSFVSMNSSDRKKYIGNFIPNIDDVLQAYEIANSNFNIKKKELKKLEGEFEKLGDIEVMKANRDTIESEINELNDSIVFNTSKKSQLEKEAEDIHADELNETLEEYNKALKLAEKEYKANQAELTKVYTKYANLKDYTDERINDSLLTENNTSIECKTKIDGLNERKNELVREYNSLMDNINNSVTIEYSETDLEEMLKQQKDIQTDIEEADNILETYIKTDESAESIILKINNANNYWDTLSAIDTHTDQHIITTTTKPVYKKFDEENYNNLKEELDNIKTEIVRLGQLESLTNVLDKRPKECNIPTCAFIKTALEAQNEINRKSKIFDDEVRLTKEVSKLEHQKKIIDSYNEYIQKISEFSVQWKVSAETVLEQMKSNLGELKHREIKRLESMQMYVMMKDMIKNNKSKLELIDAKIESLMKDKQMAEESQLRYKDLNDKAVNLQKDIEKINSEAEVLTKRMNVANTKIRILNSVKDAREIVELSLAKVTEANEFVTKNKKMLQRSKEISSELVTITKEIEKLNQTNNIHKNNIKELDKKIILAEDITERYNNLNKDFSKYKALRDTLDPKQGFPVLFIKTYLEDISDRVNELLNVAYDGAFQIRFNITSRDFLIEVYKGDGTMLNDIKQASQGELSMTTVSLSLAIMEKSIDRYNILYLDEVDATLSSENRRLFIDIVQKQIEKMGIEQVFVISHNNEYFSYPMNLVLLEGHDLDTDDEDLMSNKKIVYEL